MSAGKVQLVAVLRARYRPEPPNPAHPLQLLQAESWFPHILWNLRPDFQFSPFDPQQDHLGIVTLPFHYHFM